MFPPSDNDLVKVSSPEEPNALLGGFLNMRLASRQVESQREELAADICALTYLIRQVGRYLWSPHMFDLVFRL